MRVREAMARNPSYCTQVAPFSAWRDYCVVSELSLHVVGAKVTLVTAVARKVLSHLTRHDEARLVFKALVVRPESVSVVVFLHVHHLFNQKLGYLIRRGDPDAIDSIVFLRAFH